MCMYHIFPIHSSVGGHLGCFHDLASSLSSCFGCKIRLFIWAFSCFLRLACIAIYCPLSAAFAESQRFWSVVSLLSFASRYFLISSLISSMIHWLFSCLCIHSASLCLLVGAFSPLTFQVITAIYVLIAIVLNVWGFCCSIFFFLPWSFDIGVYIQVRLF